MNHLINDSSAPSVRASGAKTTRVTSALWGYRFTALHVTGVLPDVVSLSVPWFLLLAFDRRKIFSEITRLFLENGLVSWWFVTHDPFWRPSWITTSIIQHKFMYVNRLSETLAFYYTFGFTSELIQFLSYHALRSVFCDSCVSVSQHVLACVCCLCVKYDSMCVYVWLCVILCVCIFVCMWICSNLHY